MIQRLLQAKRKVAVLCVLLAALALCTPAFAQLDYDTYDVLQNGVVVGVIYVPQRNTDQSVYQSVYAEYWVLSDRYLYPSDRTLIATTITHATGYHYTSVEDFFANVPWAAGYRYVLVTAVDSTSLPGRTTVSGD